MPPPIAGPPTAGHGSPPTLGAGDLGLVFVGGAIGAVARVALATAFPATATTFPWTTFLENVVGAFLLAVALSFLSHRRATHRRVQLLVGVGMLGAFTTYSTLAVELDGLTRAGAGSTAVTYAAASLAVGLAAAAAGIWVGRRLRRLPRDAEVAR